MSTLGVSSMKKHEDYYLRDGNICFVVENTIFRLHRYFFERESQFFRDRLIPATENEDGSPDSPYVIRDVKIDEFAQFVWLWYNPHYSFSRKGKDHWLTVLRLATQWQFHEIRNLAIRQLETLDLQPVEKIALYKHYNVTPELLIPSYMSLCRKKELPSPEEGKMLSMETVLKIARAREQILLSASESGCKTPTTASTPDDVTRAIVAKWFELTLHSNDQDQANGHTLANNLVDNEVPTNKQPKKTKSPELPNNMLSSANGVGGNTTKGKTK